MKVGASAYDWRTRSPSKWHLDPIDDVELFCRMHLESALSGWGMFIREEDKADTVQELVIVVWGLERRFDPDQCDSFSAYAGWIVRLRATDYGPRRILGRHGTRTHQYSSLSPNPLSELGGIDDGFSMDDSELSDSALGGVLRSRSGALSETTNRLGLGSDGIIED